MTHSDLVAAAADLLRSGVRVNNNNYSQRIRCSVVISDMSTAAGETPDAIGWCSFCSVLVEAKASRADFLRDRKKIYRRAPYLGMGDFRYYIAPVGLIEPDELPTNWGLVEADGTRLTIKMLAQRQEAQKPNEITMLVSALRRLPAEIDGVSCEWYRERKRGKEKRAVVYCEVVR